MIEKNATVPTAGSSRMILAALGLIALLGFLAALLVTRHGAGLFQDSLIYLDGASKLVEGHGYMSAFQGGEQPITDWPPFFPLILALFGFLGADLWTAARWLNAVLMGVNIWITGYLVLRHTKAGPLAALFAALFLLASWQFLWVHAMVQSEPLFICLCLLGLAGLLQYLEWPGFGRLLISAVLFSLAVFTRFFGLPFLLSGAVCILVLAPGHFHRRLLHSLFFTAVSSALFLSFLIRNALVTDSILSVKVAYFGLPSSFFTDALYAFPLWSRPFWFNFRVPTTILHLVISVGAVSLVLASVFGSRLADRKRWSRGFIVPTIFIASYFFFYMFSFAFRPGMRSLTSDTGLRWSAFGDLWYMYRYFAPLTPLALLLVCASIGKVAESEARHSIPRFLRIAVPILLLLDALKCGWPFAMGIQKDGLQYASKVWRSSATIAFLKQLPQGTPIFTPDYEAVAFFAGRAALSLPYVPDYPGRTLTAAEYNAYLGGLRAELENKGAVIAYCTNSQTSAVMALDRLQKHIPLSLIAEFKDGAVFAIKREDDSRSPD